MAGPRLVVAGFCTHRTAKLLAVFDPALPSGSFAYLHYHANDQHGQATARCIDANPYSLALFELEGLPSSYHGVSLSYSIDSQESMGNHSFQQKLKLLPEGRPLRIALVSCNGAYRIKDELRRFLLWRELKKQIDAGNVDLIIHAGDQIYADSIAMKIARSRGMEELLQSYRKTYVDAWSPLDVVSVLSCCPSLMMWDDHDIYDGYGSHGDDSSDLAQTILAAAKQAFWEFQAQKNPPALEAHSFAFAVQINKTAILALDARTNRMWTEGRILGDRQLQDIEVWLHSLTRQKPDYLLVVTAIPFLHVPVMSYLKFLEVTGSPGGLVEDLRDSWTAGNNIFEGRKVLSALFRFQKESPETKVLLLSGDVHVGTAGSIRSNVTNQTIRQIVSSGIGSPPPYGIVRMLLRWASSERISLMNGEFHGELKRLLSPDNGFLLAKRNFAILDLTQDACVEFFADYNGKVVRFQA